jgi:outer membrane biogenesis lipoprotein LolB
MKDFSDEWRTQIHNFIFRGSVAMKVSNNVGIYFQRKKEWLRQGDQSSLMLFNLLTDMLAILAQNEGQLKGSTLWMVDYLTFNTLVIRFFIWSMILKKLET